ncbi:hypothetical protein BKA70DRAFT_1449221 [Coprinopsis sp. MPI-PUGE-AT-0042]|nr:hypothetical protein BKA70DRAFT_1449221 [Coprinopsis sp. MPI-PUGE-AT-0042]
MADDGWVTAPIRSRKRKRHTRYQVIPQIDLITPAQAYVQSTSSQLQPTATIPSVLPTMHTFRAGRSSSIVPTADKRQRQFKAWNERVLPGLIPVYLDLLSRSNNLANVDRSLGSCTCAAYVRRLVVKCISFDGVTQINVCVCAPARHLLVAGYFPTAPLLPTLAVDVRMLEFIRELYLRSPPNRSAWSSALEAFYFRQGLSFTGSDIIRRKLAKAAQYYALLCSKARTKLRRKMLAAHQAVSVDDGYDASDSSPAEDWEDEGDYDANFDYLKRCCPLCFSNLRRDPTRLVDVIVCLDANFTQKRRTPPRGEGRDPPVAHPETCWLSEAEILAAKSASEAARPARPARPSPTTSTTTADTLEPGMKVTSAVLDNCLDSFTAADEKRTKANTKFFADTGIMVLACRHDQPLFLANMTTPGERQFYALALLQKFFSLVPSDIKVGALYDIACQLERSCHKWGFIPDLIGRISWAVSVFHAYGHQWACQLIYHPRKCEGFGLSDGEGCERFWFSIQILIPSLRVSGYHQRLLTIDLQVEHVRETSLLQLGKWIARTWRLCSERCAVAVAELDATGLDPDYLEHQWREQVTSQTKPLLRATNQLANKEIQKIIDLRDYADSLRKEIQALDRRVTSALESNTLSDLLEQREELVTRRADVEAESEQRRSLLGLTDKSRLRQLLGNKFLEKLVKARAVKERLRTRLQGRKFELERVDRAFKRGTHNDTKLQAQIETHIARQQSGLVSLMGRYNTLCNELESLIHSRKAPRGSIAPKPLERESLFHLDVDDPIWDDAGLYEPDANGMIPPWLGDDTVRKGIQAWLAVERCMEELERLKDECSSLHTWLQDEWTILINS